MKSSEYVLTAWGDGRLGRVDRRDRTTSQFSSGYQDPWNAHLAVPFVLSIAKESTLANFHKHPKQRFVSSLICLRFSTLNLFS